MTDLTCTVNVFSNIMDDRNPTKLLLCARDVLSGIVQPWHLGAAHLDDIGKLRADIDAAVNGNADDATLVTVMSRCIVLINELVVDAKGVHRVYDRFDRARLIFLSLQASLTGMLEKKS